LGINLTQADSADKLRKEAERIGIESLDSHHTWEDIFFRLMLDKIEPGLDLDQPTLVFDYPASVSTLSKPKDPFWGERFEIFWKGMELCNGATELQSLEILQSRFEFESNERKKIGKAPHPFPQRLADIIELLPPCSGVAVGLDRLFWAISGNELFD
jgi:lysyl-tRNA synthetase class 2